MNSSQPGQEASKEASKSKCVYVHVSAYVLEGLCAFVGELPPPHHHPLNSRRVSCRRELPRHCGSKSMGLRSRRTCLLTGLHVCIGGCAPPHTPALKNNRVHECKYPTVVATIMVSSLRMYT